MWVKGQSGNPRGRPPEVAEIREVRRLAQTWAKDALERIYLLMAGADKEETQLAAALALLKIAGMNMSADVNLTVNQEQHPRAEPNEALEAIAAQAQLRQ